MKLFKMALIIGLTLTLIPRATMAGRGNEPFKWDPVTADDWDIKPDSSKKIFDAVVLFERVLADDKKIQKGEFFRTLYRRVRILGATGRDWADVEVPHLNADQKIESIYARTIHRDGSVTELTEDHVFEKELVKTKDEKIKQKTFSIPGVTDDCIIEYVINYKLPNSESEWIVQQEIPVLKAEMRWILGEIEVWSPWARIIEQFVVPNYLFLNNYSRPKITELPDREKPESLLFEIGYVPPFNDEPYSIPDAARKTRLCCYYGSDLTPMEHWGKLSRNLEESVRTLCEKNKRVEELVKQWEHLDCDSAKIAAAYHWVQDSILNLTYEDLIDEKGKKQEPKDNKTFDDIVKHGYGYRSDIDFLFCDILRQLKINAKVAFLRDRLDDLFVREAKYWQMNRSMVVVESGIGNYKFFTPGHPHTQVGMVPWFCEGVETVVGGANDYIVTIPFSSCDITQSNIAYRFEFNEDMEVEGSLSARLTGHEARTMRMTLLGEDSADFENLLEEELLAYVPEADLDSITYEQLDNCYEPFRIRSLMTFPPVTQTGSRILLKPLSYISTSDNPFTEPVRTSSILFDYAQQVNESAEFEIPAGYKIEAVPKDAAFKNAVGSCAVKFVNIGNVLAAQRFFTIKSPFWTADSYPMVKALFQAQADMSNEIVVLAKAAD